MILSTIAQLGGRFSTASANLIITTLVTAILGPTAMGILGIYIVFQAFIGVLDGGMPAAMNRAIAIKATDQGRLLRSFEIVTVAVATGIFIVSLWGFPLALSIWGNNFPQLVDIDRLAIFFSLALAFKFIQTFYAYSLYGAHKHGLVNSVVGLFSFLRVLIIAIALKLFKADLAFVFLIIVIGNICETLILLYICKIAGIWKINLTPKWDLFKENLSFMAPLSGYTIIAILLSQLDRIVISHFLTLEQFGAYALIATYAAGVNALSYAPINVFFPVVTKAVHDKDHAQIDGSIRRTMHLSLLLTFPLCVWACFYGNDSGKLIFSNALITDTIAPLWVPLFLASAVNVLNQIPHKIFLAYDKGIHSFQVNLMLLFIYPVLLLTSLMVFQYPLGIYAILLISIISTAGYFYFMAKLSDYMKSKMWMIVRHSAALAVCLGGFFAITRLLMPNITGDFIQKLLMVAWPGLVAVLTYLFIIRKDFMHKNWSG